MKKLLPFASVTLLSFHAFAQGTAFTYQGRLNDGTSPANGSYDLRFALYDAASSGAQQGNALTNVATGVSNGLFTVVLDFGNQFPGLNRWLEIGVRTNGGGAFTTLTPRQQITPTPYATYSANAGAAASAASVAANAVGTAELQSSSVTWDKIADGTITPADVNASSFSTTFWKVDGNAGTTPGTHFLGTTDNQPVEFKANGVRALRLEPNTSGAPNVVGGAPVNVVAPGVVGAVIAGGGAANYSGSSFTNSVAGDFATIGGGYRNTIEAYASGSTIGGGDKNTIQISSGFSTIAGGFFNTIEAYANGSTIGGGDQNTSQAYVLRSTIGGGSFNTIEAYANGSTIGGGYYNTIQTNANWATIPGGANNTAGGQCSFAAGKNAKALHDGSFVWSDTKGTDFASTGTNQFSIRASGGLRLDNSTSQYFGYQTRQMLNLWGTQYGIGVQDYVHYFRTDAEGGFYWFSGGTHTNTAGNSGGGTTMMSLTGGGLTVNGTFVSASDRNAKENFKPVDSLAVLDKVVALPLSEWNYKHDSTARHIGPMAQDFYGAFGVGPDDKHIATVDADGVALAAIQGLNGKLEELRAQSKAKDVEIELLKQSVADLKRMIESLPAKK